MTGVSGRVWNVLIRTHHISSRTKVSRIRCVASVNKLYALIRSGGLPGIMYGEGSQEGVEELVAAVRRLRYKDFQLAARPAAVQREADVPGDSLAETGFHETDSVKAFATQMQARGVFEWWRKGMSFSGHHGRL